MNQRPLVMMLLQNSARIICLNEADAFFDTESEKSKNLIKLFIRFGYKGIVLKNWTARPTACFVRGGPHARVELLARYIGLKSQCWSTTFGMFRCFFGLEEHCADPEYDIPTSDCLATTGSDMFIDKSKHINRRLPPRTVVQAHGKNHEIIVIRIEHQNELRGDFPKSEDVPRQNYDTRHVTRADIPFATVGVFHIHPSITHGAARTDIQEHISPFIAEYQCDVLTGDANKFANTYSKSKASCTMPCRISKESGMRQGTCPLKSAWTLL